MLNRTCGGGALPQGSNMAESSFMTIFVLQKINLVSEQHCVCKLCGVLPKLRKFAYHFSNAVDLRVG